MNLQELFAVIPGLREQVPAGPEVTLVTQDARRVIPGAVFVAIPGTKQDGHQFLPDAVAKGAIALVVSDRSKVPAEFRGAILDVPHTRPVLDLLASRFYREPSREMFCVGVTGTNGKTSTTYLVESLLNAGGQPCGVIGTVDHHLGDQVWPSEMTTPDPVFLQQRLREFRDAGARAVAMEVSSHALDQRRADSVAFDVGIFTNLTRDHLDYHKTMEDYFAAKQRLFRELLVKSVKHPVSAVINVNDAWGRRVRIPDPVRLFTFGTDDADFCYEIRTHEFSRTVFHLKSPWGNREFELPMGGEHNVQNAVGAIAAALCAGLDLATCEKGLATFHGVPGRLQSLPNQSGVHIFVDYAHSPDALENVLNVLRDVRRRLKSSAKIWTVFGCGGDRDKGKRPLMGEIAARLSDHVIVTSDNPRTEDPQTILDEIGKGLPAGSKIPLIVDRREAIGQAISRAGEGDVILIAGKGHEDYQIIGTEKKHFSDFEVAREALRARTR